MTKGLCMILTEYWMHDYARGKNIQTTLLHPVVYLVPLDALVVAFV